jgi:hypothetical protein
MPFGWNHPSYVKFVVSMSFANAITAKPRVPAGNFPGGRIKKPGANAPGFLIPSKRPLSESYQNAVQSVPPAESSRSISLSLRERAGVRAYLV